MNVFLQAMITGVLNSKCLTGSINEKISKRGELEQFQAKWLYKYGDENAKRLKKGTKLCEA